MPTQSSPWSHLAGQTCYTVQGAPFDVVRVSATTITVRPHSSQRCYDVSIQRELEPALEAYRQGRFFPRPSDLHIVPVRHERAAYVWGLLRALVDERNAVPGHGSPIFRVSNHHAPAAGQPPTVDGDDLSCPGLTASLSCAACACGAGTSGQAQGAGYHGYFENAYGEQFIFVYDRSTRRGTLWCGDAGWEQAYTVTDGHVLPVRPDASGDPAAATESLILSEVEQTWLCACWAAATAFEHRRSHDGGGV